MTTTYYLDRPGEEDIELEIEFSVKLGYEPYISGPPEACYEGEDTEFTIENVTRNGIPFTLTMEEEAEVYEWMEKNENRL